MIFSIASTATLRDLNVGDEFTLEVDMFAWTPHNCLTQVRKKTEMRSAFTTTVLVPVVVHEIDLNTPSGMVLVLIAEGRHGSVQLILFVEHAHAATTPKAFLMDMETYELSMTREVGNLQSA